MFLLTFLASLDKIFFSNMCILYPCTTYYLSLKTLFFIWFIFENNRIAT